MTDVNGIGRLAGAPAADERARLRQAAENFEAIFLAQLIQEMRASVPQESSDGTAGQDMFAGFFDDAIAQQAAHRSTRGLGAALYRQLEQRLAAPDADGGRQ
jgi:Rod binding domain-containing protein